MNPCSIKTNRRFIELAHRNLRGIKRGSDDFSPSDRLCQSYRPALRSELRELTANRLKKHHERSGCFWRA
jgi:hypothetical protein